MLNDYIEEKNYAIIKADSEDKYCLNILVNIDNLNKLDKATDGYWKISIEKDSYYVYTIVNNKKIFMHEILNKSCGKTLSYIDEEDYIPYFLDKLDLANYEKLTLIDIFNSNDKNNKQEILKNFKSFLLDVKKDRIGKIAISNVDRYLKVIELYMNNTLNGKDLKFLDSTLEDMASDWENLEFEHKSTYLFENDTIIIYPRIKEQVAAKEYLCEFGGNKIYKGNTYYRCKLFIENLSNHSIYVTKDICISEDYIDWFPTTISEIDTFFYNIDSAYDRDNEDYYNISVNLHDSYFGLKLIKKKK